MLISSICGYYHTDDTADALNRWREGRLSMADLLDQRTKAQCNIWQLQSDFGIMHFPSNDVVLTDPMYNMASVLGVGEGNPEQRLEDYYNSPKPKYRWYKTDEKFVRPQLKADAKFKLREIEVVEDFLKARDMGYLTRPTVIGPLSFLLFARLRDREDSAVSLWPKILPVYITLIRLLAEKGATWVQFDEPCFTLEQSSDIMKLAEVLYSELARAADTQICLTTFSGGLGENLRKVMMLPVRAIHFDLISEPDQFTKVLDNDAGKILSLGVIDGTSRKLTNLSAQIRLVERAVNQVGLRRVMVGPSAPFYCYERTGAENRETRRDKLKYLSAMARAMNEGKMYIQKEIEENNQKLAKLK